MDQSYPTHHSDHTTLHPMQPQFICISSCNFKSEGLEQWKTLCLTFHKKKFSIKDFFNKCDQIHSFLRIWSHLGKKSLMENFIFCEVIISKYTGKQLKTVESARRTCRGTLSQEIFKRLWNNFDFPSPMIYDTKAII